MLETDEKRLRKKVALIKTDCKEGRLQPTPAGHLQLATPRANYFLLVISSLGMNLIQDCEFVKLDFQYSIFN
jgi:hypothetical protein